LSTWLTRESRFPVRIAVDGDIPSPGLALIAGSNDHLTMTSRGSLRYTREPADLPYRPSVDVLFRSVAAMWSKPGSAALLTGMGQDGARGLLALREAGWKTIAQDQATSVVYGMPRAAVELNAASKVLPLGDIGQTLLRDVGAST
jgi:two-component system response regulator WspF